MEVKGKAARRWVEKHPHQDTDKDEEAYIDRIQNLIAGTRPLMLIVRE